MTKRQKQIFLAATILLIFILLIALSFSYYVFRTVTEPHESDEPAVSKVVPPCGESATSASLIRPYRGQEVAFFSTDGSDLYITAHKFPKGGIFDPDVGKAAVYIGEHDKLPDYDEQRSTVSNTVAEIHVTEDLYTKYRLPEGRYWLWSSNGGEIKVASCGVVSA